MKTNPNGGRMFLKILQIIICTILISTLSCTTKKKVITDDFATDATATSSESGFSDEDLTLDDKPAISVKDATPDNSDELNLENELQAVTNDNSTDKKPVVAENPPAIVETPAPSLVVEKPVVAEVPPPVMTEAVAPPPPPPPIVQKKMASINDVAFKSNDSGGALMIHANQPLEYTTRLNSQTNQIVIEVQNVVVPAKFKRPLNTKDMSSSIGHVDVYQQAKSNIARFVIQLRPNAEQPLIQPEGDSLMIVGSRITSTQNASDQKLMTKNTESQYKINNDPGTSVEVNSDLTNESIMNTTDMEEYLANNTKFYGKKISIETTDINIKDVLKFISEESGVNMVFDDSINGNISLKLRKVPWDQAFVLILKSKGLSYRRQGTVLRIATNDTLVKEEKIALELKDSKTAVEPMVVKNFSINYADIAELEIKLKDFISSNEKDGKAKGRITSDKRTNTMIVTETTSKLKQVEALIRALDTQPQQVMIEARIIEASEAFNKSLGTNWGLNRGVAFGTARTPTNIGNPWADPDPIKISPAFGYTSPQSKDGAMAGSLWLGKLGVLGDLDVQLRLDETEDRIKILSSPRITVLTNTLASINQSFKLASSVASTTANGVTTSETKFVDVGVKLNVTPQISNLGTVRMLIDVTRTGQQPGGTTNSRDMKTEVIVKSGDTSVIGGVFQSDVVQSKNGVPGLKDIPILGTFFRGSSEAHTKTELMVFVTPKILAPVVTTLNTADATSEQPTQQAK